MENIIEYLVPLIFILAFVVPKFKKKKQQQNSNQPAPVTVEKSNSGLLGKLNKMVEEYSESDREVIKREKEEDEPYDWYDESYEDEEDDEEKVEESEKLTIDVVKSEPEEKPDLQVVQREKLPVRDQRSILYRSAKSLYVSSNVSKKDLRKAIVWSEILAPPKALRDD